MPKQKMPKRIEDITWFSQFFGVDLPQYELPFIDFDLDADVPLYIDPYAITKDPSDLGAQCHNTILSYFQKLLEAVRQNDRRVIRNLIHRRLTEPSEIYLGVGLRARSGRGIGEQQERSIIEALINSNAIRHGYIEAIQELELHIEGIGADKISDLVANIILAHLASFTEDMCSTYGIASRPCAVSGFWNDKSERWDGGYFSLPTNGNHSYILVPRRFVRLEKDLMHHRTFYEKYVLDVLERELLSANDALVETLKNGKRRVTKKAIKEDDRFKLSKPFISEFVVQHPDTIGIYRETLEDDFNPVDPAFVSRKSEVDDPRIHEYLARLEHIPPGNNHATEYHHTVIALVEFVFDWVLENVTKEFVMDHGRSRIDIIADNYAGGGLFAQLREGLHAWTVPMECKNYRADMGNTEFNQLSDRLSSTTSQFGILFCRTITDQQAMLRHQTDRWLRQQKIILLIDDTTLREIIELRLARQFPMIESLLRRMIRAVQYGNTHHS